MFCLKCGAVLKDGARFCEKCGAPVVQMDDSAYPTDVMASDYDVAYLDTAGQQTAPAYTAGQQAAPTDFASQPTTQMPYGDYASQPTTQAPYGDFASQPTTQMPYGDFASQPTTQMPVDQQGGVWFQGQDWRAGAQPSVEPPVASGKRHGSMAALISVLSVLLVGIIGVSVYFVFFANPSSPSTGDAKKSSGAVAAASSSSATASGAAKATGAATTTGTKTSTTAKTTTSTSGSASTSAKASASSVAAVPAASQNAALPASNPYASLTADYVIPDSSTRTLSASDLTALSAAQLKIARNEIFARHGRMFKDADLDAYFRSRHWYVPSVDADTFDANTSAYLNDVENANVSTIRSYEQQTGYL